MRRLIIASLLLCGGATSALAQFSDNKIVIGVMGDQSGVVADVGGPGSILAARGARRAPRAILNSRPWPTG